METITYNVADHVEIDIRRPNGQIETINYTAINPKMTEMVKAQFEKIKAATAKAGRGEAIEFRNVVREVTREVTDEERAAKEWERQDREYRQKHDRIERAR